MPYLKTQIVLGLLVFLAVLYGVNIFLTQKLSGVLIDKPAKISFAILLPPPDKCADCFDAESIIKMIDTAHNIKYTSQRLAYNSPLSSKYIDTYGIENLPALIVSGDIDNKKVTAAWTALAGRKKNQRVVIASQLPYYNIASSQVKGIVSTVLLTDDTCADCFDANEYLTALARFNIVLNDTAVYDIASDSGAELVQKYDITRVPTLILSPDVADYEGFASSWSEVGTIAPDGWFVFREVQKLSSQYQEI